MTYKSERHKRTSRRNYTKRFLAGTLTRTTQLMDSKDLYWTELEALKRISHDLAWSLKNWRKLPPGMEEKEEKDGETEN